MTDREKLIQDLLPITDNYLNTSEDKHFTPNTTIADVADLLIEKGWIRPPCKVGAEIFGIFDNDDEQRKEIYEGKILCYSLDENNLLWARMRYKNGLTYWHTIDDFGKTVFLTKEVAEAELRKRSEDNA